MFKYSDKQQLLTIHIVWYQHRYWSMCSSLSRYEEIAKKLFEHFLQLSTQAYAIFWHLCPHHCAHRPCNCLANSRTWQVDFQNFSGPGNFPVKIPGLSRRRGNPGLHTSVTCNSMCYGKLSYKQNPSTISSFKKKWTLVKFIIKISQRYQYYRYSLHIISVLNANGSGNEARMKALLSATKTRDSVQIKNNTKCIVQHHWL